MLCPEKHVLGVADTAEWDDRCRRHWRDMEMLDGNRVTERDNSMDLGE
jgi:hypothetical protein